MKTDMILIAHRGNFEGKNSELENCPDQITRALNLGFHVEIDLWRTSNGLFLGHDEPEYPVNEKYLDNKYFYIHCKNIGALVWITKQNLSATYFWHENDDYTLTSKKEIWTYPGKKLLPGCVAVMPEVSFDGNLEDCSAICSDYVMKLREKISYFS